MSNAAPLRELFVELPLAVFETLQAIGEAMIAKQREFQSPRAPAYHQPWYLTEPIAKALANRWNVAEVRLVRRADRDAIQVETRRRCGHLTRGVIDERVLHLAVLPSTECVELPDEVFDSSERSCQCMEPQR